MKSNPWLGVFLFAFALFVQVFPYYLHSQNSIWKGAGFYRTRLQPGQMIEVQVKEVFQVDVDSQWETSGSLELTLSPDTKNLPFLSASEQSKNRSRSSKARYRVQDELNFSLPALVGDPNQNGLYPVQAVRSVVVDGKPTRIFLTGLIHPKYVKRDMIQSRNIVNLELNVVTEPPPSRNTQIALKPPSPEEITDPANPPAAKAELSEQEKQQILLRFLQEILGQLDK